MLSEQAILDAQNVGHNQRIFIPQLLWRRPYKLEQTIAARCDVSTVLDIGG